MVASRTNLMGITMVRKVDLPATCLFPTSAGFVGTMTADRLTNGENGLDFRYRLVHESSTNASFPSEEDAQTTPPGGFQANSA